MFHIFRILPWSNSALGFCRRQVSTTTGLLKGHSKWQNIAATKSKNDGMRANIMNDFWRRMRTIVNQGGFDIAKNAQLAALRKDYLAKSLPIASFEGQLSRLKNNPDVVITYQLVGPSNSFFLVEMEASSRGRIQSSMSKHLKKLPDFRLADIALECIFEEKGVIILDGKTKSLDPITFQQVEEIGIELECEEVEIVHADQPDETKFKLVCSRSDLHKIENQLERDGYQIISAELEKRSIEPAVLSAEDLEKVESLYSALRGDDLVKDIIDNVEYEESPDGSSANVAS